ncbi:hypothetical protein Tco_1017615 [Tanacetum coccineum]|uniref:Uncharacterized protein n=1 Tax=Tanacetum coccineum TaxID=301880 RepID=A0ABQ5FTC4_9ASTR
MDHTCFVIILDVKGKAGSVYVLWIVTRRVASAKDMVKHHQEVFVNVILVSNTKFSLSIRDMDQNTEKDLFLLKNCGEDGDGGRVNVGSGVDNSNNKSWIRLSGIKLTDEDVGVSSRRPLKKMSSPERWDANELIALGVLSVKRKKNTIYELLNTRPAHKPTLTHTNNSL